MTACRFLVTDVLPFQFWCVWQIGGSMRVKGPVAFLLMALCVAAASLLAPTRIQAAAGGVTADAKTDALAAEANTAYEAKDWGKAATLYGELSKQENATPR